MKKRTYIFVLSSGICLTLLCCKSRKTTTTSTTDSVFVPGSSQMAAAEKRWPGTTVTEVQEGQHIFTGKCTQCHKPFDIPGFSEKKWLHEIDDMAPKAELTADEKMKLTKHILSFRDAALSSK